MYSLATTFISLSGISLLISISILAVDLAAESVLPVV